MHVSSGLNISILWKNAGKQTQARLWGRGRMIVGICLHVSLWVRAHVRLCALANISHGLTTLRAIWQVFLEQC